MSASRNVRLRQRRRASGPKGNLSRRLRSADRARSLGLGGATSAPECLSRRARRGYGRRSMGGIAHLPRPRLRMRNCSPPGQDRRSPPVSGRPLGDGGGEASLRTGSRRTVPIDPPPAPTARESLVGAAPGRVAAGYCAPRSAVLVEQRDADRRYARDLPPSRSRSSAAVRTPRCSCRSASARCCASERRALSPSLRSGDASAVAGCPAPVPRTAVSCRPRRAAFWLVLRAVANALQVARRVRDAVSCYDQPATSRS
jgi:hypothetical protein